MDEWSKERFARSWDATAQQGNPTRVEQLDVLLAVLEGEHTAEKVILDLGSGSGLVEEMILERVPEARIVGVDGSRAMISLARERLRGHEGRFLSVEHDLTDLATLELPEEAYGIAVSVQTLHNLPEEAQKRAFVFAYDTLAEDGLFLNLDRIRVDAPGLYSCYRSTWRRLETLHGDRIAAAATYEEDSREWAAKDEHPASLGENLARLREAGFEAACLHLHGDRALFAARKGSVLR
jgi:tRNA (cmo5U34)-methyltransferase